MVTRENGLKLTQKLRDIIIYGTDKDRRIAEAIKESIERYRKVIEAAEKERKEE